MLLAQLTPHYQYYPQHLQVMQEVKWATLSPLSQHISFYTSVQSILEQARTFGLFHNKPAKLPDTDICSDKHLLKKTTIQDSAYRVHGFGAENYITDYNVVYIAWNSILNSIQESQVCHIAKLVDGWSANLRGCPQLLYKIKSLGEPLRSWRTEEPFPLGYDTKWLDPPAKYLPRDWYILHTALSHSMVEKDKYRIMMFLSTLTYSQHSKQKLIQTLLAFATVPELYATRPPDLPLFQLSHSYRPDKKKLAEVTNNRRQPFYLCPESNLPQLSHKTFAEADKHQRDKHQTAVEKRISQFVDALIYQ